jgi:sugar (pentulose or hexulose) kinase
MDDAAAAISQGRAVLGIELGSTRIKAVLIGPDHEPLATGTHAWENQYVDRTWTYSLDAVRTGLAACYASLALDVKTRYGADLRTVAGLGISAMMHGYLALDADGELLAPFRTWRNTSTGAAAERLSTEFGHNVPHRWSVAHLYQAILDHEEHVPRIAHLTTLAGYVHSQLTGERVLGIGDASGMFPIDIATGTYDRTMLATFDRLAAEAGTPLHIGDLLPAVQLAGQDAGRLTEAGAALLDPSGTLRPGAPLCPPEGDAGTGMVATNSIAPRTGNVSAGTSVFAMVVLERPLTRAHRQLDLVTTPDGRLVAMVHCNNGASELNAWVGLFIEFAALVGAGATAREVFDVLLRRSLDGAPDGGGLLAYNNLAGEPITELDEGRPLFLRTPDSTFDLATFMRTQLFAALATLRIGMDVLRDGESVRLDQLFAHGGLFTTKGVVQRYLAAALETPVSVGDIAGEGGAWGIAVLAAFSAARPGVSLQGYLSDQVFATAQLSTVAPDPGDVAGFDAYLKSYLAALPVERAAITHH